MIRCKWEKRKRRQSSKERKVFDRRRKKDKINKNCRDMMINASLMK